MVVMAVVLLWYYLTKGRDNQRFQLQPGLRLVLMAVLYNGSLTNSHDIYCNVVIIYIHTVWLVDNVFSGTYAPSP